MKTNELETLKPLARVAALLPEGGRAVVVALLTLAVLANDPPESRASSTLPRQVAAHEAAKVLSVEGEAPPASTPRVRSTNATILDLLNEGNRRSATFRALTELIERLDAIVYVEFGYCAFGHLNGCLLRFIASSDEGRYLRIVVTPDKNRRNHDQLLALIAHELQHALEVIEHAEVASIPMMDAMYWRIGTPLMGGIAGYETSAARAEGDAVLAELLANRR